MNPVECSILKLDIKTLETSFEFATVPGCESNTHQPLWSLTWPPMPVTEHILTYIYSYGTQLMFKHDVLGWAFFCIAVDWFDACG